MPEKTLKVGSHIYKLILEDLASGDCGETDYIKSTIQVAKSMSFSMKGDTLTHEVMHAINTTLGDEHIAHALMDSLASQIFSFYMENGLLNEERLMELVS